MFSVQGNIQLKNFFVPDEKIARKVEKHQKKNKNKKTKMVYGMSGTTFRVHIRVHPQQKICNKIRMIL